MKNFRVDAPLPPSLSHLVLLVKPRILDRLPSPILHPLLSLLGDPLLVLEEQIILLHHCNKPPNASLVLSSQLPLFFLLLSRDLLCDNLLVACKVQLVAVAHLGEGIILVPVLQSVKNLGRVLAAA